MKNKLFTFSLILIFGIFFSLPIIGNYNNDTTNENYAFNDLPVVGSYDNLKAILEKNMENNQYMYRGGIALDMNTAEAVKSTAPAATETSADSGYSSTNTQVAGVDEADIIKTDGEYIYQVNNNRIVITDAYPAESMQIIKTIEYKDNFYPQEIYVDDQYLTVIGTSFKEMIYQEMPSTSQEDTTKMIMPPYYGTNLTKVIIYDISDKENIKEARNLELEGNYVSSRKIGSSLYLVSNKYLDVYYILNEKSEMPAPSYKDSAKGDYNRSIDYNSIRYIPNSIESNYLIIAGLDLANMDKEVNIQTYLGAGENIYASESNLYVTVTKYSNEYKANLDNPYFERSSLIYKFKLENGFIEYQSQGEVPGSILNQFSMDEYNGYFRIATTTGDIWRTDEYTSKNNLYVLNDDLKTVGQLEDLAPGEQIYSVRFTGERAYIVTFRTVDPLFVIDLKEPTNPTILGKLKIPGYSNYLHPYDENHVIGFGKDTIELKDSNNNSMAYYQGMKVALFDVTDVNNPKEKFVETIGDRGTDSDLLYNHKALLFSKEKELLAFPVTVTEVSNDNPDSLEYGNFSFQGAYVYHLDLETGFDLEKKITHLSDDDYLKAGDYWYDGNSNIQRIIYIEDTLYTISNSKIKAHSLETYKEINSVNIPVKY